MWQRNVPDEYKHLSLEEIKLKLKENSFDFAVCFENWQGDFNMSTGIRNANGCGAKEVFYYGKRRWDRRGAVGTHNYTSVSFVENEEELLSLKDRYSFVAVDNLPGAVSIDDYEWQTAKSPLMIFGEEGLGLSPEMQKLCDVMVEIPMYGSVRSFNCGTSSGMVMRDYIYKLQQNCGHSHWITDNGETSCPRCKKKFQLPKQDRAIGAPT